MYRRIELIRNNSAAAFGLAGALDWRRGFSAVTVRPEIFETRSKFAPKKANEKNYCFYFTERGWQLFGRDAVAACQQFGQRYRLIAVRENAFEVLYRDEIQVMVGTLRKTARDQDSLPMNEVGTA